MTSKQFALVVDGVTRPAIRARIVTLHAIKLILLSDGSPAAPLQFIQFVYTRHSKCSLPEFDTIRSIVAMKFPEDKNWN